MLDIIDAQIVSRRLQHTLGTLSGEQFDPATRVPPPVRSLLGVRDPKLAKDVAGLMLGITDHKLQVLMGANGLNGSSEAQQSPVEGTSSSSGDDYRQED